MNWNINIWNIEQESLRNGHVRIIGYQFGAKFKHRFLFGTSPFGVRTYSALVRDKSDQCSIDIGNDNVDNFIYYTLHYILYAIVSELFMVQNVYLGFFDKHGCTYWWIKKNSAHCEHVPCSTITHSTNEDLLNIKRKGDPKSRTLSRTSDTTETHV
jgi:hypothetical protein